jgi:hypothetical protein
MTSKSTPPLSEDFVLSQELKDVGKLNSQQISLSPPSQVVLLSVDGFLQEGEQLFSQLPEKQRKIDKYSISKFQFF